MRRSELLELVKKDLKIEIRSKAGLNNAILFALTTAFLFSLSIDAKIFFAPILVLVTLFSSILACSATVTREFELETIEALKASLSAQEIITSKILSNFLIVLFLVSIIAPICYALFNLEGNFFLLLASLAIVAFPISSAVTLLSPISAFAKGREAFLATMLFPIIFPVILPGIKLLNLAHSGVFDFFSALFLLFYAGVVTTLAQLVSDHLF
ncbi:MAG: heme exporter protein CcmB [Archaeoglobaceae archaeon]